MNAIPLGPFVLHTRIGYGGAGEVWRGTHVDQGVPVAVKVLTAENARQRAWQEAFRAEVRSVAGLHHPGIVTVFDHGEVTRDAERLSPEGTLVAGSPYLAMELVSGGSLKERRGRTLPWTLVEAVLMSLLDALAHAHARGVVHRDVKPGNVLLPGPKDLRPGPKLTDFGIAHAQGADPGAQVGTGTPAYMAPELIRGNWRDYGPWTDLYALGCLGWELTTGTPPFGFGEPRVLARAHAYEEPPAYLSKTPVPQGFEAWLRLLLEKDPQQRFERCADAAYALCGVGPAPDADEVPTEGRSRDVYSNPTLTLDATLLLEEDTTETSDSRDQTDGIGLGGKVRPAPAPSPPSWRREAPPPAPLQLVGAGLGLWGLRTAPIVDRETERDRIWEALLDVRRERRPRVLVLHGAAGNGKSRLVQWMGERAHELGAATVLEATHSPMGGPSEGLARMVARRYQAVGLDRSDLLSRLTRVLSTEGAGHDEAQGLTELLAPGGDHVRLDQPVERWALVKRALERTAARRQALVWLDDVQWGADALRFVQWLLSGSDPLPVLLLLTVQEEALAERSVESGLIDQILRSPRAGRVAVQPLPPADQVSLVRGLLSVEPVLAAQVAERTGGNPLFAVHLLGDWVQRGVLESSPTGFRLRAGASADLPDDVHQVWGARVDRVVAAEERHALEIAACLGREIDRTEWEEVCWLARVDVPPALVSRLVAWRLAEQAEGGWAFVHGMLREAVLRSAVEAGRAERWHRACARMLASRSGAGIDERRGRHLGLAGAVDEAATALLSAARQRYAASEALQGAALVDLRDQLLDAAGVPADDLRRGESLMMRADLAFAMAMHPESEAFAVEVERQARSGRWAPLRGQVVARLAYIAMLQGELPRAARLFTEARALHQADGQHVPAALALRELGHVAILAGDLPLAESYTVAARGEFEALGDRHGIALCLNAMGDIRRLRRDWVGTAQAFREAMRMHADAGNRSGVALCRHGLAEVDRLQGRLAEAEAGYQEVIALDAAMGRDGQVPKLNLGLCLLAAGRYPEARHRFDAVRRAWEAQNRRGYLACVYVDLLPAQYATRDFGAFDRTLSAALPLLAESAMVDLDIAWPAQLAGDLAARAGDVPRAQQAYAIALAQWRAMGDGERVAEVEAALAACDEADAG